MFRTENFISRKYRISVPNQIIIAIFLGIFTGLFFGDLCKILQPISNIYTMLIEVAIYPYIIATLLSSLGRLSFLPSLRLFKNGVLIYLLLVTLILLTILAIARAFPIITSPFRPTVGTVTNNINLLSLIIPANLFESLSNNYVPAVVIFCILFGVMLQRVKGENVLFKILDTLSRACVEYWDWLIKFAPVGVFAAFAYAAGTLRVTEVRDSLEYILLFFFGALLLAFWLIPCVISSFTDLPYRSIMRLLRDAIIISVSTTMSILALPYLYKITRHLLSERRKNPSHAKEIIETTALASYPFGQLGNCFIYLFILFASTYYNQPLTTFNKWVLPLTSYLSSLGSPNTTLSAINFLGSWLAMPNDIFNFYSHLSLITIYPQVLVSVMCIAFLVILISFAYYGLLRIHWQRLFTHLILIGILFVIFIYLSKTFVPDPGIKIYQRIINANLDQSITQGVIATVEKTPDANRTTKININEDAFTRIQKTGVLRVGFYPAAIPFSYFNNKGELVGYDIAHMYILAKDLKSKIEFVPFTWLNLQKDITNNNFDIAVGGIWATNDRIEAAALSNPYIKNPAAFLVPKDKVNTFSSLASIHALPRFGLGIYYDPSTIDFLKAAFPNAALYPLTTDDDITNAFHENKIDAVLRQEIPSLIYSLGHPGYAVIPTPSGVVSPYLVAYMMPKKSEQFRVFINYWLDLQKNSGFSDRMYDRWILGRPVQFETRRWSIMRDVLHIGS